MYSIIGTILGDELEKEIVWEIFEAKFQFHDDGVAIRFPLNVTYFKKNKEALNYFRDSLSSVQIDWLKYDNAKWVLDLDKFKDQFAEVLQPSPPLIPSSENEIILEFLQREPHFSLDLLSGKIIVEPEVEESFSGLETYITSIIFNLSAEFLMQIQARKIFLSHKGVDKPRVRRFKQTLEVLGFEPWIDEDNMNAGKELHRGLLEGIKDSCAVVFFITKNYKDESFLATEIDYAIEQKRLKGDKFAIITLIMAKKNENYIIPELLKRYVWKTPNNDLVALQEIVKALPIHIGIPKFPQ